MKADESYLDSLLSSVVSNPAESVPERPVRKTTAEPVSSAFAAKEEQIQEKEIPLETEEIYPEAEEILYEETEADTLTDDSVYNIFNPSDDSYLDDLFADSKDSAYEETQEEELLDDLLRTVDDAELSSYEIDEAELSADAEAYAYEEPYIYEEPADISPVAEPYETYDELDEEAAMLGVALADEVFSVQDEPMEALPEEPESVFQEMAAEEVSSSEDDIMDFWNMMNMDDIESVETQDDTDGFGEFPSLMDENGMLDIPDISPEVAEAGQKEEPKKKNIFHRLFGNIREDLTAEQIEERKRIALEKFEEDELRAADEAAKEKLNKEERARLKEEEAEQKKLEKEQLARKKREAKLAKEEQKRLRRDKKEQARRALLAEIEANEGRINKVGASIIFVMFAVVLCFIVIGTGYYNYKISIEKAQFDFDLQRYDDAYNDVYGLDIKEEDMELYDKIMTVQYVNIQLLSYMRYNALDMDAEALDSLLKGLRRYEKFIQYGAEIGVVEDLDYLKKQILQQLDEVFGVDEATAYSMIQLETQGEYSVQLYDIVSKRN